MFANIEKSHRLDTSSILSITCPYVMECWRIGVLQRSSKQTFLHARATGNDALFQDSIAAKLHQAGILSAWLYA